MITMATMPSLAKVLMPCLGAEGCATAGPAGGVLTGWAPACPAVVIACGCAGAEDGCSGTVWSGRRASAPHFVQNRPLVSVDPHLTQKFAMEKIPLSTR